MFTPVLQFASGVMHRVLIEHERRDSVARGENFLGGAQIWGSALRHEFCPKFWRFHYSGFRNFIFWPYQALPGFTGVDGRRQVTRVTGVASLHGCTANELMGWRVN